MGKKDVLTKILLIAGTALVWLPILAPIWFFFITVIRARIFRFDYLMPAEFFPLALLGGGLLIWAALRARSHRGFIGWSFGIAAGSLVGGQVLAVVTGLASGAAEPTGWWWSLVLASLAVYSLALIIMGVGGILWILDLFRHSRPLNESL